LITAQNNNKRWRKNLYPIFWVSDMFSPRWN